MEADKTCDMNTFTLAEIALNFPHSIKNLIHYDLDFFCGGRIRFVEACEAINLNAKEIWIEITEQSKKIGRDTPIHFANWNPDFLISFIVQHHLVLVKRTASHIQKLLEKMCDVHGEDNGFLLRVREDFEKLTEELFNHLPKEEEVLFSAILRKSKSGAKTVDYDVSQHDLDVLIAAIVQEHDRQGSLVKSIRALTGNYAPPAFACSMLRMTYLMLDQFNIDLIQRIHLENNVLLPKISRIV